MAPEIACARVQGPVSNRVRRVAAPRARCPVVQSPLCGWHVFVNSEHGRAHGRRLNRAASRLQATADRPWSKKDARIVLEDGTVLRGSSFGARGTEVAEVVFNTSITGYQEIMTDPSYKGQFVCFTHPHIGNTGINLDDMESAECHMRGIIVRDRSIKVSNYRSVKSLEEFCEEQGVLGIAEVDTRQLTRCLRETGCLVGVITTDESKSDAELVEMAKGWTIVGKDLLSLVTCKEPYEWKDATDDEWEFSQDFNKDAEEKFHVVAYDFGIKHNILRRLTSLGCRVTVVPCTMPAIEVLAMNPDGVFFSNGPGDPSAAPYAVENAKEILGSKPVFGICMGHQVLGQAFGGTTFKLKFGHHGANHPIRQMTTGVIEISSQNHNFAVDPDTLPEGVEVSHINLNDGTCAGMVWKEKKQVRKVVQGVAAAGAVQAMTIQYHPEASPGPHDADICFSQFVEMMRQERAALVA